MDLNVRNRVYFSNPLNRKKHGELSKRNWTKADYRAKQQWRTGIRLSPSTEFKKGQRSPRYLPIGSRRLKCGRWWVKVSPHGHADSNWRAEHCIIAEQRLGRPLLKGEHVHHIDFDIINNHPDNLYVATSNSAHKKLHQFESLIRDLLNRGVIKFDRERGVYYGS